jgi:hypothetical protein
MTVADAWFEHTMASLNWKALKSAMPMAPEMAISAVLDLYVGGTILHTYEKGNIYCINCEYMENRNLVNFVEDPCEPVPACACHMGIVRACAHGIMGTDFMVHQEIGNRCRLSLQPIR